MYVAFALSAVEKFFFFDFVINFLMGLSGESRQFYINVLKIDGAHNIKYRTIGLGANNSGYCNQLHINSAAERYSEFLLV